MKTIQPKVLGTGPWARGADFIAHCNEESRARLAQLITHQPVEACVWRSDVLAALACHSTAATVFNNWLTVMDITEAFHLDADAMDGPIPVMLLKHFLDGAWVESPGELAAISAVAADLPRPWLLAQPVDASPAITAEEADEAAAQRAHMRKVHRNQLLVGLGVAFMRRVKAGGAASASPPAGVVTPAFDACLSICDRVAAMYPVAIWPNTAAGSEPSAAQLGRTVASSIAEQIRTLRDASLQPPLR